jgi:hypothetical protein
MKPITAWYKIVADGKEDYNHFEDGHVVQTHPSPKGTEHKSMWKNGKWVYKHVYLTNDLPPKMVSSADVS